jgi:hypothetical protein
MGGHAWSNPRDDAAPGAKAEECSKIVSGHREDKFAVADRQAAALLRKLGAEADPEHTQRGHHRGAGDLLFFAALYLDYRKEYEAVVLGEGIEAEARRKHRDLIMARG